MATKLLILCPLIFLAGFIDSIAGGGGLISLTSYMACGIPGTLALGTNKFSSIVGGTIASANYVRTGNYEMRSLIGAVSCALLGSWIGSSCSMLMSQKAFSIVMLAITPAVAVLAFIDKDYSKHEKAVAPKASAAISAAIGLTVGFYDGFYGAGAGMFMQMGFIMLAGINAKKACGNARMVNWASNFAALVNFLLTGNVLFEIAIPCAAASVIGNFIGSKLAIKKDVRIIRPMMLCVTGLLFAKVLWDLIKG